jgi:hypothetical protein
MRRLCTSTELCVLRHGVSLFALYGSLPVAYRKRARASYCPSSSSGKRASDKALRLVGTIAFIAQLALHWMSKEIPTDREHELDPKTGVASGLRDTGSVLPYRMSWQGRGGTPVGSCVPGAQRRRRYAVCSAFEIARMVGIGDEPGLFRLPAQQRPGTLARGRDVHSRELRKPAKMLGRFFGGLGDDRQNIRCTFTYTVTPGQALLLSFLILAQ